MYRCQWSGILHEKTHLRSRSLADKFLQTSGMIPKSVAVSPRSTIDMGSMEAPFERSFRSPWLGRCIDIVVDKVNLCADPSGACEERNNEIRKEATTAMRKVIYCNGMVHRSWGDWIIDRFRQRRRASFIRQSSAYASSPPPREYPSKPRREEDTGGQAYGKQGLSTRHR